VRGALRRKTRLRWHNPSGELMRVVTRNIKAARLKRKRKANG